MHKVGLFLGEGIDFLLLLLFFKGLKKRGCLFLLVFERSYCKDRNEVRFGDWWSGEWAGKRGDCKQYWAHP